MSEGERGVCELPNFKILCLLLLLLLLLLIRDYKVCRHEAIPSSRDDFVVARFGHTLIPRSVPIGGSQRLLRELFFNPSLIKNNIEKMVDSFTIGSDPDARSQMPDTFIVEEVSTGRAVRREIYPSLPPSLPCFCASTSYPLLPFSVQLFHYTSHVEYEFRLKDFA